VNSPEIRKQLQEKLRELESSMAEHESEARVDAEPEVREHMDQVTSAEDAEGQFQQATLEWQLIVQVRDALSRLGQGTYGTCIDCGRRIEPARLAATPWTPYCNDDQERHDRLSGPAREPTL
jgi:DnaK suppressor protein